MNGPPAGGFEQGIPPKPPSVILSEAKDLYIAVLVSLLRELSLRRERLSMTWFEQGIPPKPPSVILSEAKDLYIAVSGALLKRTIPQRKRPPVTVSIKEIR